MTSYLVTYFQDDIKDTIGLPLIQHYLCEADNTSHAVEQMKCEYDNGNVVGVYRLVLEEY